MQGRERVSAGADAPRSPVLWLLNLLALIVAAAVLTPIAVVVALLLLVARLIRSLWHALRALVQGSHPPPTSTELTEVDLSSDAPIVCLVHGTFASRAAWADPAALLGTAIAACRGDGPAPVFQRIEWSGDNTVEARLEATAALEARLSRIFSRDPGRRVILIGHSHGGNVALKAAERFAGNAGLRVVTLATPFLIAQVRADAARLLAMLRAVVYLSLAVPCAIAATALPFPWLLLPAAAAALGSALAVRALVSGSNARNESTDALLRSVPDLQSLEALIPKTLIVTRSGDEADGLLKVTSFLNAWVARALRESELMTEFARLRADANRAAQVRLRAAEPGSAVPRAWPTARESLGALDYLRRIQRLGPEMIGILAGVTLLLLLRVAIGTRSGLLATTVVVTSSETPPGAWHHVQTLASVDPASTIVSHSQIYDDPEVCALVARWVAPVLGSDKDTPTPEKGG